MNEIFQKYYEKLETIPEQKEYANYFETTLLDPEKLYSILEKRKEYSHEDLLTIVKRGLDILISYDSFNKGYLNSETIMGLIDEAIANISFTRNVNTENIVATDTRYTWCRICYDYMTSNNTRKSIIDKIISITSKLYYTNVKRLMGFGLSEKFSAILVIARYSSTSENFCVKRLNFAMMTSSEYKKISEQTIIYIYEAFFDSITVLFLSTYFDTFDSNGESISMLTDQAMQIYNNQNRAIVEILNNTKYEIIEHVLKMVCSEYYNNTQSCRFSLLALSGDYARVSYVAETLRSQGYIVP